MLNFFFSSVLYSRAIPEYLHSWMQDNEGKYQELMGDKGILCKPTEHLQYHLRMSSAEGVHGCPVTVTTLFLTSRRLSTSHTIMVSSKCCFWNSRYPLILHRVPSMRNEHRLLNTSQLAVYDAA